VPPDDQRINSLRLRDRELDQLLDAIEANHRSGSVHRAATRWGFRQVAVDVTLTPPGGSHIELCMACRNISQTGIGLLHRSYVHVGTRCTVSVNGHHGDTIRVNGRVARCMHITGMVHEIGIHFDHEIDVRSIVRPDPTLELSAVESVDTDALSGSILVVDTCAVTLKLIKHFLKSTQLRVRHASTIAEASTIARDNVGLILCDAELGEECGGDFIRALYENPAQSPPVVLFSADTNQQTRDLIRHPGVAGFMAKPFTQEFLLRTVAEFYCDPDSRAHGDVDGFRADHQIVSELLPELQNYADRLERTASENPELVRATLVQISGVAPVLGLSDLAMHVESLAHQVSAGIEAETLREKIEEIARLCRVAAEQG